MLVEITTFRLVAGAAGAAGADEAAFLAADKRLQTEFIPNHPGFVRRTTARSAAGDGGWATITLWGSAEQADASAALAAGDAVVAEFNGFVDSASVVVHRYETLD